MDWPLVGRASELGFVGGLLADAAAGGLVVVGAPGVGKTRLAVEVSRLAAASGATVEWVRATRSAGSIPLGALAGLLPASGGNSAGGADLLARARHALVDRAAGRRLVLCVDDGHLLDAGSAALLHQLVAAGEAFAVVTLRRDEPAPDALRALWKDELCAFLEIGELSRGDLAQLLSEVLGGPVDGAGLGVLWDLTRGNALFVRELVLLALQRGVLVDAGGVWRWRGQVAAGTRLAELVGVRLAGLATAQREVLELVAVGAPLETELLAPHELAALEALETQAIVERRGDGRRRTVGPAHPLHGELVLSRLASTRREAVQRRLADAVQGRGARRRGDVLRVASWRLRSGAIADRELFERAAGHALAMLDFGLAARFAQVAVDAGAGFGARLSLARAAAGAGRAQEADVMAGELEALARTDAERSAVAIMSARNLFWALDRAGDADAVLRRAEQAVRDRATRDDLVALRAWLLAARGRPAEALTAANRLLRDAGVREPARLQAALAAADALAARGRSEEAVALTESWEPVARRHRDALPLAHSVLLAERASALRHAGRLVEATRLSERTYELSLSRRPAQYTAAEATALGFVWLARGRPRSALRFCREGVALLRDADAAGMLAGALAGVGQAAAQAGERELARAAVAEMEHTPLGHRGFATELGLARAWSAAGAGELSRARALALEAADLAAARGQHAFAARALHELCRLGDPAAAAPRLALLARRVDGPFAAAAAAHAAALVARDGRDLMQVAERFAGHAALLVAAEAASAAAVAFGEAGRPASGRAASARAAVWLAECEGARSPALLGTPEVDELTPREHEISLLAASGLSSRRIAEQLVVSVRTVDNTLQRAYRKLGISRRADLAALVTVPRAGGPDQARP